MDFIWDKSQKYMGLTMNFRHKKNIRETSRCFIREAAHNLEMKKERKWPRISIWEQEMDENLQILLSNMMVGGSTET